ITIRYFMKAYLISSSSHDSDAIVNVFDAANVSVIAKEMQDDEEAISQVEKVAEKGGADIIIFVTDNHQGAGIELNKMDGVRAAVCNDEDEVRAARSNNANVIIINPKAANQEGVARAIVQGGGVGKLFQTRIAKKSQPAPKAAAPVSAPQRPQKPKQAQKQEPQEEEEEPEQPRRSGGSIFDRIKDELGIVD
ncbi:MAG: RpiB/LacA/LacB family sugar-phosphate isomerase, partial [Candidatus Micrarchaeota archaeon]|nr:RpiB/LacA/LacB family sugar-phosphate isomerase [Candidatus Micrarchaeota archaeon]